jgi:subtilisin family serine protease
MKRYPKICLLVCSVMLFTHTDMAQASKQPVPKLSSNLQSFVGQSSILPQSTPGAYTGGLVNAFKPVYRGKRMFVEIRLHSADPAAVKQLEEKGLKVSNQHEGLVSGYATADALLRLADLEVVSTIRPFVPPLRRSIVGEGVEALRADLVHNSTEFPYDGTGIKIGIISDSFSKVSEATPVIADIDGDGINEVYGTDSQLLGEVPGVIELLEEADALPEDCSDEGRAMAEIVHEMAPGAALAFHTAWNGLSSFANGIVALATAGCNVIVDDVFYLSQPFYQDGEVSKSIRKVAREYDVVYLTAHGNSGAKGIEGIFRDIDPEDNDDPYQKFPSGDDLHNWVDGIGSPNAYLPITVMPSSRVSFAMNWENPYSGTLGEGATTDYDLYCLSEPDLRLDTIIYHSTDYQGMPDQPYGDPLEMVFITNQADVPETFYLALNKHHGPAVPFKIVFFRGSIKIRDDIRSTDPIMYVGHNKVDEGLSIAAVNYLEVLTDGSAQGNPKTIDPAYYSSNGGSFTFLYDGEGNALSEPHTVFKPDFASVDGTNNSFFVFDAGFDEDDYPNFYGTSAAAPHAAAIAAMMRQANPALTAAEIRDLMRGAATDIHLPGVDSYTGTGLLYADDAIAAVPNKISPEPNPTATPTLVPLPSPTPTMTPVPEILEYGVIITDTLDAESDLSGSVDYDAENERVLALRWNLPITDVKNYHVYVSVNGEAAAFLGITVDPALNTFEWKAGNAYTATDYAVGPKFGHRYQFFVYVLTESGEPHHFGPYGTAGAVEYLESK